MPGLLSPQPPTLSRCLTNTIPVTPEQHLQHCAMGGSTVLLGGFLKKCSTPTPLKAAFWLHTIRDPALSVAPVSLGFSHQQVSKPYKCGAHQDKQVVVRGRALLSS